MEGWAIAIFCSGLMAGCVLTIALLLRKQGQRIDVLSQRVERLENAQRPSIVPPRPAVIESASTLIPSASIDPWPQTLRGQDPPLIAPPIPGLTPEEETASRLKLPLVRGEEDTIPPALRVSTALPRAPSRLASKLPPPPLESASPGSGPEPLGTRFMERPVTPEWAFKTASDSGFAAQAAVREERLAAEPQPPTTLDED
ncbi:MAG: hypothetical protein U1E65_26165 [Myxococcota bacterium]